MSYAPVSAAREEGLELACLDGEPPPDLDALDFAILTAWSDRTKWADLARQLGVSVQTIRGRAARPAFQGTLTRLRKAWFDQLSRGEFGALALARANVIGAIKGTLRLMHGAEHEKVQLEAQRDIIKLAGVIPVQPKVIERPDTLLDEMTQEELEHFSVSGEFPRRLHDKLARVAASVLQAKAATTVEALDATTVEWEPVGGTGETEGEGAPARALTPESTAPAELPDDDGPAWAPLPEETVDEGGEP